MLDGKGLALHDVHSTAHHTFSQRAAEIMCLLRNGASFLELSSVAKRHGVATWELTSLLGSLNTCGALRRKRTLSAHMRAGYSVVSQAQYGIRYPTLTWRRKANMTTLVMAVLRACTPILPATILLDCLLYYSHAFSARSITSVSLSCLVILVLSIIVHEAVHFVIIKHKVAHVAVVQKGMRVGIIHPRLSPAASVYCAVLGPLAGCIVLSGLFVAGGLPLSQIFIPCGLFIHLGSLLPWYGDGATIKSALARKFPAGGRYSCTNPL